jgi:hypothetical protein
MTLERIKARCEEDGDCLLWTGKLHKNGSPSATEFLDGKDCYVAIRRRAYESYRRVKLRKDQVITTCSDPRCLAKAHLECITIGERSRRAHVAMDAATKIRRSMSISAAQKGKAKLTKEQVAAIKNSEDGPYVTARRIGVSGVVASRIVRGLSYRDYVASPFTGLGA